MAKQTDLQRAIDNLEAEITNRMIALDILRAVQRQKPTAAKVRKPRLVSETA